MNSSPITKHFVSDIANKNVETKCHAKKIKTVDQILTEKHINIL